MEQIVFKSFLSHRYKSPDVNLYFFRLFKEVAQVQFEVDEGKLPTNVTRLERMIRNSDAFVGIYPFPGVPEGVSAVEALKDESKYFRLEIDLAIRSQKPAIIFYDQDYGDLVRPPDNIFSVSFNKNEITGAGGFPSFQRHKREFIKFCEVVSKRKDYDDIQIAGEKNAVAIAFSPDPFGTSEQIAKYTSSIRRILEKYNYTDIKEISCPVSLSNNLFRLLEKVDFAIVDHGGPLAKSGLPSYLHGRFIPMIRVQQISESADGGNDELERFLFNGLEVGYKKDKISWDGKETLLRELESRIQVIRANVKRINTFEEAEKYFLSASLRKEAVFVSYSGKDVDMAKKIISALTRHYQEVFDYRDGKSIKPGEPWIEEIYQKLKRSAIGINLLSSSYLQSGHCLHEAQQMVAYKDDGGMKLFPVKLQQEQINLPEFFGATQYMRLADYPSAEELVKEIVRLSALES